ncbi:MAG TPA: hypothetical protein PK619_01795 [bacterium]|nr:hypothetical protein [bacterium]HPW39431.1 hypothetical protein [bacterium]HQA63581.1 hypothetical protein [bacterium]
MSKIKIIISWEGIKREFSLTLKNYRNGNFRRWGLKPILPARKKAESYLSAAKRYYLTSDWKDEMQRVIPKINNWWQKDGRHLSKKIARAIGVKEPNIYNIIITPFGPGGGYDKSIKAIFLRITDINNNGWWKHVILHEIAHLLKPEEYNQNHRKNEDAVDSIVKNIE